MNQNNCFLNRGDKIEDLQNGYAIIQNPKYFSFGTDAILLADFAHINARERVVDFCTGCGIVPILLCAKTKDAHITGIEIQRELADMAQRSVAYNKLKDCADIICGDIKEVKDLIQYGADAVTANPPYEKIGAGKENANKFVNIAKREVMCTLDDVVGAAASILRTGGRLYMIYRTERFAELMACMRAHRVQPKRIRLVAQHGGAAPGFALVEGRKGAKEGVTFMPQLIVYADDGAYTKEIRKIYHMEEEE